MHCQPLVLRIGPSGGTPALAVDPTSATDSRNRIGDAEMLSKNRLIEEINQFIAGMPERTPLFLANDVRTMYQSDSNILQKGLPSSARPTRSTTPDIKINSEHHSIDAGASHPQQPELSINQGYCPAQDATAPKQLSLAFIGGQFKDDATSSLFPSATDSLENFYDHPLTANEPAWDIRIFLSS